MIIVCARGGGSVVTNPLLASRINDNKYCIRFGTKHHNVPAYVNDENLGKDDLSIINGYSQFTGSGLHYSDNTWTFD